MFTGRYTGTAYSMVVVGLILISLFFMGPWPLWISIILVLLVLAAGMLMLRTTTEPFKPEAAEFDFAYEPEPPRLHREKRVTDILLPSSREDYYFLFSATVLWSPARPVLDESRINLAALAVNAVIKRAQDITRQRSPEHASLVQHELGGALGRMQPDATGNVLAMAESIQLVLPEDDRQRLDRLAGVRKEKALWEHARKYEQSKREYLGEDVLKDPGSAVVWWLARNDDQVEKTVENIHLLALLSSAANNQDVPELFQRLAPVATQIPDVPHVNGSVPEPPSPIDHLAAFLGSLGWPEGSANSHLCAHRFAQCVETQGRPDVAEEIRRRFTPPPDPQLSDEPVTEDPRS